MRKPLLYSNPKYFKLLNKYRNLYARLKNMLHDGSYYSLEERIKKSLLRKFKLLYQRIGKMQIAMGIKTAGIAMAFTLVSTIVDAQMPKKWIENEAGTALFNSGISHGTRNIAKFVDIDNDGDDDLFLGGYDGDEFTYKFFENKGKDAEELFVDADNDLDPVLPISSTSYYAPSIDFMDNDGDGDLDVFAVNPHMSGDIDYYKNIGTQSAPKFELTTGTENTFDALTGAFSLAFEDIDQDEDLDLIIDNLSGSTVRYFENEEGSFNEKTGTENPFVGLELHYTVLDFQDMDGDGDIDAIANEGCSGITYLENIPVCGESHYLENSSANPIDQSGYGFYPSFADLDEDGDMDLILSEYYSERLSLIYHENDNNAFTNLGAPPMITLPINFETNEDPKFIDIDGDGDLDMYVDAKTYYGEDRIYENIGDNSEPELKLSTLDKFGLPKPSFYETEAFVDIDNDGDLDMFTLTYYEGSKFYKNIGTSTEPEFELQVESNNPLSTVFADGYINDLAFTDLDGDGDFDAILGQEYATPTLNVLKNTGTKEEPAFVEESYTSNPFEGISDDPLNIEFADLDNDGDQDLIFGIINKDAKSTGAFLLFKNISTETEINFEAVTGTENPLETFNTAYGNFAFTKLFNEDEISFIIKESEDRTSGKKPIINNGTTKYYSYKDLLSMHDKSIGVDENTAAESTVTILEAEYYGDVDITYTIDAGEETIPFDIDAANLIIASGATVDYEALSTPTIQFTVTASDGTNEESGIFTVTVNNLNDNAPVLEDQTVSIDENPTVSDLVATLNATDADELGELTYSITAGNDDEPFEISSNTIVVKTASIVDYETVTDHKFTLSVEVSDGELTSNATVTVNINDVNEATSIEDMLRDKLMLFPNPTENQLNLMIGSEIQGEVNIKILDSIGKLVRIETYSENQDISLDVSDLNSGIYFVQVSVGENSITKKIIKK